MDKQTSQGSFVAHGHHDVMIAAIGRLEHLGHVHAAGADVKIKKILWTGSKDLLHVFVHGSWRPGAADAKSKGPAGGVDHIKNDSTTNVVL